MLFLSASAGREGTHRLMAWLVMKCGVPRVRSCPLSGISKSKSEIPSALPFCDEGTFSFSRLPARTPRPHPGNSSLGVICESLYPSSARGRASPSPGPEGGLVWDMVMWAASPSQSAVSWERFSDHTPS